jgi:hypothetical protein
MLLGEKCNSYSDDHRNQTVQERLASVPKIADEMRRLSIWPRGYELNYG